MGLVVWAIQNAEREEKLWVNILTKCILQSARRGQGAMERDIGRPSLAIKWNLDMEKCLNLLPHPAGEPRARHPGMVGCSWVQSGPLASGARYNMRWSIYYRSHEIDLVRGE